MKKIIFIIILLSALGAQAQVDGYFDCDAALNLRCNKILNPGFSEIDPSVVMHDFRLNNIPSWYDSHGSSDVNWNSGPPFTGANPVAMHVGTFYEGVGSKISPLVTGRKYAYSFFIHANAYTANNVRMNVVLTKCENLLNPSYATTVPVLPSPNQKIYCENLPVGTTGFAWKQVFVEFTAQDNFDMIRIYPDQTVANIGSGAGYIDISYPELIDITSMAFGIASWEQNCVLRIPGPCTTIKNAVYTWRDPNNNIVQQGGTSTLLLNLDAHPPGIYTLTLTVPGAVVTNNTCSSNTPVVTGTYNVVGKCECGSLEINDAEIEYWNTSTSITLNICDTNRMCGLVLNGDDIFNFSGSSSQVNGNIWEVRVLPDAFSPIYSGIHVNGAFVAYPASSNFTAYSSNANGDLELITVSATTVFYIEIKLTNTILNTSRLFKIKTTANVSPSQGSYWCVPQSPNFPYPHKLMYSSNTPGFSYLWSFPTGMTMLSSLTNAMVEWDDTGFDYTANPNPVATITVGNIYGCPPQVTNINIGEDDCWVVGKENLFSDSKKLNNSENQQEKQNVLVQITPNPVSDVFKIQSKKIMERGIIFNSQGIALKTLNSSQLLNSVNIGELKPGVYFIKIFHENNSYQVKSIIKQ